MRKLFFFCLLICPLLSWAQQDTTGLQFSTETIDPEQWNKKIKFQRSNESVMDNVHSILTVGIEGRAIGFINNRSLPFSLNLHYERNIFMEGLYFNAQFNAKLFKNREWDYDYQDEEWPEGTRSFEAIGNRKAWINLGARYYYNKVKRIGQGRSGSNPYGQYVLVNLISPLAWFDETSRNWAPSGPLRSTLISKKERQYVGSRMATLAFGWGVQYRLWNTVLLDANLGPAILLRRRLNIYDAIYTLHGRIKLSYLIFQK